MMIYTAKNVEVNEMTTVQLLQSVTVFTFACTFWTISASVWSFRKDTLIKISRIPPPPSYPPPSPPRNVVRSFEDCSENFGVVLERTESTILEGIYNNSFFPYKYDAYLYATSVGSEIPVFQIRIGVCPQNYTFSSSTMSERIGLRIPQSNLSRHVFENMTLQPSGILPREYNRSSDIIFEIMYADTRTNSFGEYIPTLNQNHELLILSGVSEWDNLILDPRRSAVFDTQIRTNTHRDLYADTERRSESYCENTYPESQSSTTDIELDVQVDDCENNVHVYKSKTLEYLKDFDLTLKYDNISVDIDDINTDCNVNNTLELRLNNIPVGALGFLSDDSRFTKNIVTFMSFLS